VRSPAIECTVQAAKGDHPMNLQESRSSRGQLPIAYAPVKVICENIEGGGYKLRSTQKLETFNLSFA